MAQLFQPETNRRLRVGLAAVLALIVALGGYGFYHVRSAGYWNVGKPAAQPIAFRHDLHVSGLGVDCRYCHTSAARAAHAGMPSAQTCLTCHSQIWRGVAALEPLRTSVALDQPIAWRSVHRLPAHVRFHHGAHVSAGVACSTCHGNVATMVRTVKAETLSMGWCLACHRHASDAGTRLTDCSVCHY